MSHEFAHSFQIACYALAQPFHINTVESVSLLVGKVYRDCVIEIEGYHFLVNLIPISLSNFDIILGMKLFKVIRRLMIVDIDNFINKRSKDIVK